MADKIVEAVLRRYKDRAKKGLVKYGTTMDRNDLSLVEWLQHLQEEMMDATVYIEKLKQEINYQDEDTTRILNIPHLEFRSPCVAHDEASQKTIQEEELERRMNIIGQNGNDGLHYEDAGDGVTVAVDYSRPDGWDNTTLSSGSRRDDNSVYACGICDYYCIGGCKEGNI